MTPQQISRIWTIIGLFLLYYTMNSWIVAQGGQEIFGAKLIVGGRAPAAMWAIPITCAVLFLNSIVGVHYARRAEPYWYKRIPIVGFETIVTSSPDGKFYQGSMLFLLSLLPSCVLIHFWRVFHGAKVVTTDEPPKAVSSIWDWSALTTFDDPARICTEVVLDGEKIICEKNATILPGFEPTLFALLTAVTALAVAMHWYTVFRRPSDHLERAGTL